MIIRPKDRTKLVDAAMGRIPLDLMIKNTRMVNVFTGEIYEADICIYDGFTVHVKADPDGLGRPELELEAKKVYDAKGHFAIPGLLDMHIHIESTMMTPRNFARAILVHGTTTVVTDPHEIANVFGVEGVSYMIESSSDLPMRQLITIPSCVPAVPGKENAGAEFHRQEVEGLLGRERVIGLAEVMDFPGVVMNSPRMVEILDAADRREMFIQGHILGMTQNMLSAYRAAGPVSDHETRDPQEARDKLRAGMYVDARQSSITRNVSDIVRSTADLSFLTNLTFCTDDREPKDILSRGHMNDVVRAAIDAGMNPVEAIRHATLNAAGEINAANLGAIAPGYVADILLMPSLEKMEPSAVFFQGNLVAENGRLVEQIEHKRFPIEERNSVFLDPVSAEDFLVRAPQVSAPTEPAPGREGLQAVNVIAYLSPELSPTRLSEEELPVKDGCLDLGSDEDLKFVCIMNRHEGHSTRSYGVVRGFGSRSGAIASTVSHDCHNMTVVYDSPADAAVAVNRLIECGGGMCCARNGSIENVLELPLAGLMSLKPCDDLAIECESMKSTLRDFGLDQQENPLLRIATLALPVIPEVKMSDLGIVDVMSQQFVPLFPGEERV